MKNTWKIVPLFALALLAFGCGPGGGAAGTPEEIGDGVKDAIVDLSLEDVYGFLPAHEIESEEGRSEVMAWRYEEGYEKWDEDGWEDWIDERDPDGESGIEDEDSYKAASAAVRHAFGRGFYKLYDIEDRDDRLSDGLWYRSSRDVDLDIEGQGEATFIYRNKYGDEIGVRCIREDGLWALSRVDVSIPKDTPEKPKASDDD